MKTNVLVILLLVCCFRSGLAQEKPKADTSGTANVPEDYQLSDKQLADWKSIQNAWYATEYDRVKYDMKITTGCKTCNAFYMDVIIKINGAGKMESYKVLNGKACGRAMNKAEELRMMKMFFKFEFAGSLRNTTFKTRLGTILKC